MVSAKIKEHFENKKYCRITRAISDSLVETISGYIVDYSDSLIILQEANEFEILGFHILPVNQIKEVRFNRADRYCDKIITWEGEKGKLGVRYQIDLSSWATVFKSLKKQGLIIIIECEAAKINTFNIGPITRTVNQVVYIQYFDATGYLDEKSTSIDFESITKVQFDTRYINVFGKYLRRRKKTK